MDRTSITRSVSRARRIAWSLAALAALAVAAVWVQGHRPQHPLLPTESDVRMIHDHPVATLALAGLGVLSLMFAMPGPPLFYRLIGRSMRATGIVTRSIPLDRFRAEESRDRALAELLRLGFRVGAEEPLTDGGWRVVAENRGDFWSSDPRKWRQSVELRYSSGMFQVTHRGPRAGTHTDLGIRDYQEWMASRLMTGEELTAPPRYLSSSALLALVMGLSAAAFTGLLVLLPEPVREVGFMGELTLLGGVTAGVLLLLPLACVAERRWSMGKDLAIAGCLLLGSSWYLWTSRWDEWQTSAWRTSDDPHVLVRAGASAWRDCESPSPEERMTAREHAALEAYLEIEHRLVAMGPRTAPALVEALGEDDALWCGVMLDRLGPAAVPALLQGLAHRRPAVRSAACNALAGFRDRPDVRAAVCARLRDPEPDVRAMAAAIFSVRVRSRIKGVAARASELDETTKQELVRLLDDPEAEVRSHAAYALAVHGCREAVPKILSLLERDADESWGYLQGALERLGDPRAIPALVQRARSGASGWNYIDWEDFGADAIDPLLDALDEPRGGRVHHVLRDRSFRKLQLSPPTLDRLLALADGDDIEKRRTALSLLARSIDERAVRRAVAALEDPDPWVRVEIVAPLLKLGLAGPHDLARLLEEDDAVAECTLDLFWKPYPEIAPKLAAIAEDSRRDTRVRRLALGRLEYLFPEGFGTTAQRLAGDPSLEIRAGVTSRYTCSGSASSLATATLLALLREPDDDVRALAAQALGDRPEPGVVESLIALVRESPRLDWPDPRVYAVTSLGRLRAAEAVPALCELLTREGFIPEGGELSYLGAETLAALGEIGDPSAKPTLRQMLERARHLGNIPAENLVACALAMTGDESVIPILLHAIRCHSHMLCGNDRCADPRRQRAVSALGRLGERGAAELLALLEDAPTRPPAAEALGRTGSARALPALRLLLIDESAEVRRSAATGLRHLEDERAIPDLLRALEDDVAMVACVAAEAIEHLAGEDFGAAAVASRPWVVFETALDAVRAAVRAWAVRTGRSPGMENGIVPVDE